LLQHPQVTGRGINAAAFWEGCEISVDYRMSRRAKKQLRVSAGAISTQFSFGDHTVRTVQIDEETWFVAHDICQALELANPTMAVLRLENYERVLHSMETLGGDQRMIVIN